MTSKNNFFAYGRSFILLACADSSTKTKKSHSQSHSHNIAHRTAMAHPPAESAIMHSRLVCQDITCCLVEQVHLHGRAKTP